MGYTLYDFCVQFLDLDQGIVLTEWNLAIDKPKAMAKSQSMKRAYLWMGLWRFRISYFSRWIFFYFC